MISSEYSRFAWFRVRTECTHCGHPLPLNEIRDEALCQHCLHTVSVPLALWADLFSRYDDEHHEIAEGERENWSYDFEGLPLRVECGPGVPVCEKCGAGFSPLHLNAEHSHVFYCLNCSDPASTEPAPGWMSAIIPTAKQIVFVAGGEGAEGQVQELSDVTDAPRLVAMNCPSCGGGLNISAETTRLLPCTYCSAEVYIPDPIWRRLHPVRTMQPIYVRYQGPSRRQQAEEDARLLAETEARLVAQREAELAQHREARRQELHDEAQRASAEQNARVDALVASARWGSRVACSFWVALFLWAMGAESVLGVSVFGAGGLNTTLVLALGTALSTIIGMHLVSRPMQESTGHPGHWIFFETWFWLIMLVVPLVGPLMALARAFILFRGRIGASHIQVNSSHFSYEAVEFQRGESYPAAWLFVAIGLGLPLVILAASGVLRLS